MKTTTTQLFSTARHETSAIQDAAKSPKNQQQHHETSSVSQDTQLTGQGLAGGLTVSFENSQRDQRLSSVPAQTQRNGKISNPHSSMLQDFNATPGSKFISQQNQNFKQASLAQYTYTTPAPGQQEEISGSMDNKRDGIIMAAADRRFQQQINHSQWDQRNLQSFWSATGTNMTGGPGDNATQNDTFSKRIELQHSNNRSNRPSFNRVDGGGALTSNTSNRHHQNFYQQRMRATAGIRNSANKSPGESGHSQIAGHHKRNAKEVMELAVQQKHLLNALFKKNSLHQEREKQSNTIKYNIEKQVNTQKSNAYNIVEGETKTGSTQIDHQGSFQGQRVEEGNVLSPNSWKHFKHNSLHHENYSKAGVSNSNGNNSPFRSSINFNTGRHFSPYNQEQRCGLRTRGIAFGFDSDVNSQQLLLIDKELDQIVRSMKMLDQSSLNEAQIQTLKELSGGGAEEGLDLTLKEKQLRNMISEIKLKSENMRRKKLNYMPQKQMKPTKGQPSFMTAKDSQCEIEQILKRKVDNQIVMDFLGQNAVGDPQAEENSSPKAKQCESKDIKINLVDEYKDHLTAVSKLQNFASMKMYMDHTFFKVYMPDDLISSQGAVFDGTEILDVDNQSITLKSTILPAVHSFLEPQQEAIIPKDAEYYPSTQAHFSLLNEVKDFLHHQILSRDILVGKDEHLEVQIKNLRAFFFKVFQLVQELMRIQSKDSGDIASALITDNLFKIMMIKVDEILANNNRIVQNAIEDQKHILKQMKKEMEEEIKRRDEHYTKNENHFNESFAELKEKLKKALQDSKMFQELYLDTKTELTSLTQIESRVEQYEGLKQSFSDITQFLMEAEDEKIKSIKVLDQYQKLMKLGSRRKPKVQSEVQSKLSLNKLYPFEFNLNQQSAQDLSLQSEFMNILSLVEAKHQEAFKQQPIEQLAQVIEATLDEKPGNNKTVPPFQSTLLKLMISIKSSKGGSLVQNSYNFVKSLQHFAFQERNAYAKMGLSVLQLDQRLLNQALQSLFLRERLKFIEFLKQQVFKGILWNETFLFLNMPYSKVVQYARQNFKDCREVGEYFFQLLSEYLDLSQVQVSEYISLIRDREPIVNSETIEPEGQETSGTKLTEDFFKRCSSIVYQIHSQRTVVYPSGATQNNLVDALGSLDESGWSTKHKALEELQQVFKKLNLWVSTSDLIHLLSLMDPEDSGIYQVSNLTKIFEKQKLLSEFYNSAQFMVGNYLYAMLAAFQLQLSQCQETLRGNLYGQLQSCNIQTASQVNEYQVFENVLKTCAGLPASLTEEDVTRAFSDYIVGLAYHETDNIDIIKTTAERMAKSVIGTVENLNPWISSVNKR